MKKILKYSLLAIGVVVLLAVAVAAFVAATFDPNTYKPQIIKAVKESKQRDLKLEGAIKLTFFPSIGASIGRASLSEFKSEQEFAAIESAHVSLKLWPLLSKQVVVDKVAVSGMTVHLVKHKDGTLNISDLTSPAPAGAPGEAKPAAAGGPPVKFDIASVALDGTTLSYRDEATGAAYSVKDLTLKTGRIANGVPTSISLGVHIQANQPKADIAAQLKTDLTFDLDKNLYQLANLDLDAKGAAVGIENLVVKASGDANANLGAQEFGAKRFSLTASGTQGSNKFDVKFDAPSLSLTKDKVAGDLVLAANLAQPEQSFKVKLATPVSGNVEAQQFNLSNLTLAINATGDKLPNKSVSSEMKGNVKLDIKKQDVALNLAGGLLQSQVKADVAVKNFAAPAIRFNVDVDQFDADIYLPKKTEGGAPATGKQAAAPEQPFDLSGLQKLDLDGSLKVGSLKAANVKTTQLRVDVKAHKGVVNVNPLSANLYQGTLNSNVTVNAAQATPSFAVNAALNGVNIRPLAKDAANLDMLEGRGNVTMNLNTQGNLVSTLKKRLNGTLALNLADGAIKGINLQKLVQSVQSLGKGASIQTMGVNKDEKTPFSEFKATFKVVNGVAHNDDLSVKAPLLRLAGNGNIDIGNDSMDYTAKATVAKTEGGGSATLPVHLSGPFTDLKYTVDFGAMLGDIAKQKVKEQTEKVKEEAKQKLQEQLKEGLKGLFK
jgi:AsmA protein